MAAVTPSTVAPPDEPPTIPDDTHPAVGLTEEIGRFRAKLATYLKEEDLERVCAAYRFAADAHRGQFRISGDPYVSHPLAVAETLANGVGQATAVWLITSEAPMWDARGLTQAWLTAHGAVTDQAELARVAVTRYELRK